MHMFSLKVLFHVTGGGHSWKQSPLFQENTSFRQKINRPASNVVNNEYEIMYMTRKVANNNASSGYNV